MWCHNFYFIPKSTSSVLPQQILQYVVTTTNISLLITNKFLMIFNKSIYFVNKKEVEWRRKKLGGSQRIYPTLTYHVTYHHPKSRSTNNTTIRSSLHCVVIHTCATKNYYYLCAKKRVICAFNAQKNACKLAFA